MSDKVPTKRPGTAPKRQAQPLMVASHRSASRDVNHPLRPAPPAGTIFPFAMTGGWLVVEPTLASSFWKKGYLWFRNHSHTKQLPMSATKDEKVGEGPLLTLYELTAEPDAELVPSPTGTLVKWSDLDSLLADGTLRLVETVTPEPDAENPKLLKHCGEIVADDWGYRAVFCPKCGSRIAYP